MAALSERAFVPVTVLLEFEWVMRGFYGLARAEIGRVFAALTGIAHVSIEDRANVIAALDLFGAGLDFADALHLSRSGRATAFVTFDHRLAKRAAALAMQPRVERLG